MLVVDLEEQRKGRIPGPFQGEVVLVVVAAVAVAVPVLDKNQNQG